MDPIKATFRQRLRAAMQPFDMLPRWLWVSEFHTCVVPLLVQEAAARSDPDSPELIRALTLTASPSAAYDTIHAFLDGQKVPS